MLFLAVVSCAFHLLEPRAARVAPRGTLRAAADNEFDISLAKPLGILFEEEEDGSSALVVADLLDGSAKRSTFVWLGDQLLTCNGVDVSSCGFDEAMEALVSAPDELDLTFKREGRVTCVDFPNGQRAFAKQGEPLYDVAKRVKYHDKIVYECMKGSCGTCELVLQNGGSGSCKSIRMCRAKVPAADLSAWELLTTDSREAQEFFAKLQAKAAAPTS